MPLEELADKKVPEKPKGPVNESGGDHEARVESPTNDPPQRIPTLVVEPVPELIEAVPSQELSDSVIEVGVKLVDHALVAQDAEETSDERQNVNQEED